MSDYVFHDPDRGEEIERRKLAAERRLKEREGQRFWERCLADPIGRKEIWRLLSDLNTFETRFPISPVGMPDGAAIWFAHGRKDFGQTFWKFLIRASREGTLAMMDEHDPAFAPEPIDEPNAQSEDE